jgi:hypothetical protein
MNIIRANHDAYSRSHFDQDIITGPLSDTGYLVMLGHKAKLFKMHPAVSIDELVPLSNFYRKVEAKVDLTFVLRRPERF